MRNRRYSDNDRHLWPFTLSHSKSYRHFGIVLDSGAREDCAGDCHIRFAAFGWTLICELPQLIPDFRIRHDAKTWDAATIARLGRDWYEEKFPREYGFSFSDGDLHTYFGPQAHDSRTTKSRCFFLPWRHWRHIRHSLYDLHGKHFYTEPDHLETKRLGGGANSWAATQAVQDVCPKAQFEMADFDGERIIATTNIEEREWHFGTGFCRWLSWFRRPKISRDLKIDFSKEVGPEKGSWKGGTVGHSIEMLPGELHEAAFKRYCDKEHRAKGRRFRITYIGKIEPPPQPDTDAIAADKATGAP